MSNICNGNKDRYPRLFALTLSLSTLLLGVLYYVIYREHALASYLLPMQEVSATALVQGLSHYDIPWMPSFTHAFASVLFLHAIHRGGAVSRLAMRIIIVAMLLGVETSAGTFDVSDMLAIAVGMLMAEVVAGKLGLLASAQPEASLPRPGLFVRTGNKVASCSVICASALVAAASYSDGFFSECARFDESGACVEYKRAAVPVYMSYSDLRESVRLEAARAPDRLGRIYLYQDYLFLNEHNEGIHIIDNREPTAPVNLGFIRIPGNTEVAIRDNYLYADSYVDLITLALNDPLDIQIVNRQEDLFPYDALQSIPYNVSLSRADLDPQRGVIVAYQLTGN